MEPNGAVFRELPKVENILGFLQPPPSCKLPFTLSLFLSPLKVPGMGTREGDVAKTRVLIPGERFSRAHGNGKI